MSNDRKAGIAAFGLIAALVAVAVIFCVIGIGAWTVEPTCGGAYSTPTKILTSLLCLLPIIMAFLILKLVAIIGKQEPTP